MQLTLNLPNPLAARQSLFLSTDGKPFTTSRAVAERFGKRHDTVLRAIQNLLADCPDPGFIDRNFAANEYTDKIGRTLPEYRLTHDGFAFLAMRFTGRDAMAWQIAFLQAFNAMEAQLASQTQREAEGLWRLRPQWQPIARYPSLSRANLLERTGRKSVASVTSGRRRLRELGVLVDGGAT